MASVFDPAKAYGHFALNLFPDTALTAGERPDLEIVLLVDISGSQSGWPLEKEKQIAGSILDRLLPTDRLCVLAFSDYVYWCFGDQNPVPASAENVAAARAWVNARTVIGGTQLLAGIQAALSATTTTEHSRYYVFLTDGFITNEEAIYDALRDHPSKPTVFTFGAGNSLNRYFLEQTAAIGNGYATEITQLEDVVPKVDLAWEKIATAQVRNINVDFNGAGAFDLLMPFGTNLYRNSPVVVYGKYTNPGLHTVTVRGYRDGQPVEWARDITFAAGANANRMVPQVWARQKIEQLVIAEGATTANKDSIIAISIDYQVLSKYTAFLAINPMPLEGDQRDSVYNSYGVGIETSPAMADLTRVAAAVRVAVEHGMLCVNSAGGAVIELVEMVDLRGRSVHTIRLDRAARVTQVRWDGRLSDGTRLGAGRYVVRVKTDRGRTASTVLWR